CLQAISRLYFEGLLIDLDPGVRTKRDTGKPMPLAVVDTTPIEEVVTGPLQVGDSAARASDASRSPAPDTAAQAAHGDASTEPSSEPAVARTPSGELDGPQRDSGVAIDERDV